MGLREDRAYLQERKATQNAVVENALKASREEFNNRVIAREDARAIHEAKLDKFYAYKDDVKKTLMKKALMELYTGSFKNISNSEYVICENLIEQYIGENGTTKILKNMRFSESSLLRTIAEKTDEFSASITADANAEDPDTQIIDPADIDKFWKDIDKSEDVADITDMIRMRVSNAEEDFVNRNQQDKANVNTILKQTADRVQAAKDKNDNDYSEMVEESETRIAKNQIYKVQHESHRNVFDRMVRNISTAVMVNESMKSSFTMENGRLNMDHIIESARCMYTLLETVSTIGLENVDQAYIEDTLKSIC